MNNTNETKEAAKPDTGKLQALREGYQNNLNQTQQQIAQLSNTLQMLNQKVEQLKGAIFGLQELEQQLNPQAAVEAATKDAKPAAKEAKAAKGGKSAAEVTKAAKAAAEETANGAAQ